jgi:hypothetical protein
MPGLLDVSHKQGMDHPFKVEDIVWLHTTNIKISRPCKKLNVTA